SSPRTRAEWSGRRSRASSTSSAPARRRRWPRCSNRRAPRVRRPRTPGPAGPSLCARAERWMCRRWRAGSAAGATRRPPGTRPRAHARRCWRNCGRHLGDEPAPAARPAGGGGVTEDRRGPVTVRRFLALALPALGVLAAEPLYLLFDVAIVGRLGAEALAGLALGALVLSIVGSQLTFLSYGTTARAARLHGAGDRAGAVGEGVQATWLAVGVGVVLAAAVLLFERPLLRLIAGDVAIAGEAVLWLRIAVLGVPAILVTMAGNGGA